jgi:hypothetical protein
MLSANAARHLRVAEDRAAFGDEPPFVAAPASRCWRSRVETDPVNPHWLVLTSSCGRFDILAFSRRDSPGFDPNGAAAAATAIKAHVARVRSGD